MKPGLIIALLIALLLVVASTARADKLAEARQAVDEVRYDDARRLLVEAIDAGGNAPVAVRQIYELSASTAIVLGQRELGEQYYRRWLALDPAARLPSGSSPKLTESFVAAQAFMAAHGRLVVKASRPTAGEIEVVVESDPLIMAAGAAASGERVSFGADHRARLYANQDPATIKIFDEHGNELIVLDLPAPIITSVADHRVGIPSRDPPRSFSHRWTTWAVPAAACVIAGAIFGTLAITANTELDQALANSGDHFLSEIDDQHRQIRRNATIGISLGSAGVLLAIPATVLYVRAQRPWNISPGRQGRFSLSPVIGLGSIGLAGSF